MTKETVGTNKWGLYVLEHMHKKLYEQNVEEKRILNLAFQSN